METKKKKLTKSELKEMVRQELQSVLAEKKKVKDEDKKEKMDEAINIDPEFLQGIGGLAGLIGVGAGLAELILGQTKKKIVDKLKASGKEIPSDKELDKMAAIAAKGGIDKVTGGASLSQSTTGKGGGLGA